MLFDLTGKVAIVTGASSGLGMDAAKSYAEHGADVAILARRKERLDELAKEITASTGKKVLPIKCDVTSEKNCKEAVAQVLAKFGKVDILLNNAGYTTVGSVDALDDSQWDKEIALNIKGIIYMSKYCLEYMRKVKSGKIINISSINAFDAEKKYKNAKHPYNMSKSAVLGLTRGMAGTYAQENINVNAICPGLFASELTERMFASESYMARCVERIPANRTGSQGELNGAIIFLSSEGSNYIHGQYLIVDGGLLINN